MGLIITPQSEIDEYFNTNAMSQSTLKVLQKGIDAFLSCREEKTDKQLYYEEKGSWILGSGVDLLLTGHEEEFDKQFYCSTIDKKPSDTEMSITHQVFDTVMNTLEEGETVGPMHAYHKEIYEAVLDHNWQPKWKPETQFNKICDACNIYFEDLKASFGKQVIDATQKNTIDSIVMSLKTHRRTAYLFDREAQRRSPHVDVYLQVPIYFVHKGVDCKALLDIVVVFKNEEGKVTHIIPFDIKTMAGNTIRFIDSVKLWRYDIQAAWYTLALRDWFRQFHTAEDCHIKNFQFVVESSTQPGKPLIYRMSDELMQIGREGRESFQLIDTDLFSTESSLHSRVHNIVLAKEIKGYEQLMDEYIWYEEHGWVEDRVIQESTTGVLELEWNGIVNQNAN